jgi:hypothetical protein
MHNHSTQNDQQHSAWPLPPKCSLAPASCTTQPLPNSKCSSFSNQITGSSNEQEAASKTKIHRSYHAKRIKTVTAQFKMLNSWFQDSKRQLSGTNQNSPQLSHQKNENSHGAVQDAKQLVPGF